MSHDSAPAAFPWSDAAERVLNRSLTQLRASMARLGLDRTRLDTSFVDREDGTHEASFTLTLPDRQISAVASFPDPAEAVRGAFRDLGRQLDAFQLEIDTPLRHRVFARTRVGHPDLGMWDDAFRTAFARDAVPAITRHVQHELAERQATGSLDPGWVDVREVVDEAVLEAMPSLRVADGIEAATFAVQDKATEVLDRHVAQMDDERARLQSLSEDAPVSVDDAMAAYGDEVQAFWVVDEDMHVEDVLADADADDAAAITLDHEVRHALVHALFTLPGAQRRLFEAVVMDGLTSETVAHVRDLPLDDVTHQVDRASEILARRLDPEVADGETRTRALYATLGRWLREAHVAEEAAAGVHPWPWTWGE